MHTNLEVSSLEPSHSRQRKLRLRNDEDWWGTTAKEMLVLFSPTARDKKAISALRITLRRGTNMEYVLRLADKCELKSRDFTTALAILIHEAAEQCTPIRIQDNKVILEGPICERVKTIATYLETLTPYTNRKWRAWRNAEIPSIEARLLEFLGWYWLN